MREERVRHVRNTPGATDILSDEALAELTSSVLN
jgi:hypothetical protein